MLVALSINNIILIDKLNLELNDSLSVLTGETGAGKSILLDALTLALGGRGEKSLVRKGQEKGSVVAEIFLPKNHQVFSILKTHDVEIEDMLVLKRVQYVDGRTRAFINDQAVSASLMKKIGALIVEIHGQHDDRALVDGGMHRNLLDSFGGHEKKSNDVKNSCVEFKEASSALEGLQEIIKKAQEKQEYATHVVEELSQFNLRIGEEEELSTHRQKLMTIEKSVGEVSDAEEILNGHSAPALSVASLMRRLERKNEQDGGLFSVLIDSLEKSLLALDESSEVLENLKREMVFDKSDLENTEERLFALRALARKHEVLADDLPAVLLKYQSQLERLHDGEIELKTLKIRVEEAHADYIKKAQKLSEARIKTARELEKAVNIELPDLKLERAKFIVNHEVEKTNISPNGFDGISFFVQTNPGTSAGAIMKVASGGELSRFLLALKVVLAERTTAPVLIFDEIDSGVGGAVADAIGRRLARLAKKVQVICVTHAPQVAARAKNHLLIEKLAVKNKEYVQTNVRQLNDEQKSEEIARMLAGAQISDEARAAAKRLISEVG